MKKLTMGGFTAMSVLLLGIGGGAVGGALVAGQAQQAPVQVEQTAGSTTTSAALRAERAAKRAAASAKTARTKAGAARTYAVTADAESDDALAAARRAEASAKRAEEAVAKLATRPCPDGFPAVGGDCGAQRSAESRQHECLMGNDYHLNANPPEGECVDGEYHAFPAPTLYSETYTKPDGSEGKTCWVIRPDGTKDYRPCE